MSNKFNRAVLQQVAKDGLVYKSLAKEMAQFILEEHKEPSIPCCRVILKDEVDPNLIEIAKLYGCKIALYEDLKDVGRYTSYMLTILDPELL